MHVWYMLGRGGWKATPCRCQTPGFFANRRAADGRQLPAMLRCGSGAVVTPVSCRLKPVPDFGAANPLPNIAADNGPDMLRPIEEG